jgi:CRISPR-associated endonuclease/helicase Cas3
LAVAFRTAAERFRLIDDEDRAAVVVFYRGPDGTDTRIDALFGKLEQDGPQRWLMRALQRYTVSIPRREAERMLAGGDLRLLPSCPGLYVQASDTLYDPTTGLLLDTDRIAPDRLTL